MFYLIKILRIVFFLEESDELFLESLVCVLSREYSTFLKMLIVDETVCKTTQKKDNIELISPLGKALLSKRVFFFNKLIEKFFKH